MHEKAQLIHLHFTVETEMLCQKKKKINEGMFSICSAKAHRCLESHFQPLTQLVEAWSGLAWSGPPTGHCVNGIFLAGDQLPGDAATASAPQIVLPAGWQLSAYQSAVLAASRRRRRGCAGGPHQGRRSTILFCLLFCLRLRGSLFFHPVLSLRS